MGPSSRIKRTEAWREPGRVNGKCRKQGLFNRRGTLRLSFINVFTSEIYGGFLWSVNRVLMRHWKLRD